MAPKKERKRNESLNKSSQEEKKDVVWSEKEDEDLLDFYTNKYIDLKQGNLGKGHWNQCVEKVNVNKNENDLTRKTSQQYEDRWNSMRRKYLGERAREDET
jgi:hypothetical protein